jgi:streptomycin 6-kinase
MILPSDFIINITQAYADAGRQYLADLPGLLTAAASRWSLTLGESFLLSYNYVCTATRADGMPVVLKVGVPNVELTSEINALRVYDGQGACRLYEADAEAGMLLLERLLPGKMLVELDDDDRATEIAADVMVAMQRPAPARDGFLSLRGWFDDLKTLRPKYGGGTGPFSEKSVATVEELLKQLLADDQPQVLLHGDFHHYNILSSERGWLVIDPKGVIGPAEYEVGPLLMNPLGQIPPEEEAIRRTRRRIAILAERTSFDPQRLRLWAICHSLLSAWWDTSSEMPGSERSRAWIEIFLKTKIT